jgi:hypothetical protein
MRGFAKPNALAVMLLSLSLVVQPAPAVGLGSFESGSCGYLGAAFRSLQSEGRRLLFSVLESWVHSSNPVASVATGEYQVAGAKVKVGKLLGRGFWGAVFAAELVDLPKDFSLTNPKIFAVRDRLVIKIGHKLPWPLSISKRSAVAEESRETSELLDLMERLDTREFGASQILYSSGGVLSRPFLLKELVIDGLTMPQVFRGVSTDRAQFLEKRLKEDVYDPARMLLDQYGVPVDLRPENLYWSSSENRFRMYELTVAKGVAAVFVRGNYDAYRDSVMLLANAKP